MKKVLLTASAFCLFTLSIPESAFSATNEIYLSSGVEMDQGVLGKNKGEKKSGKGAETTSKREQRRMDRENYKQRKKMEKASRKENRRGWGTNKNGDAFHIH